MFNVIKLARSGICLAFGTCSLFGQATNAPIANPPAIGYGSDWIDRTKLDYSVPEAPAFAALGVSSEQVVRPATPRDFAFSLLNGLDAQGNFQTGVALDTAPYLLLNGANVSLNSYRSSRWQRFASRAQLSFGTAKGISSDDESTRVGLGFRFTFLDLGDPRMSTELDQKFSEMINKLHQNKASAPPAKLNLDKPEETFKALQEASDKETAWLKNEWRPIQDEFRAKSWNRTRWDGAFAPTWINTGDGSYRWDGASVWSSFAYGFEGIPGVLKDNASCVFHVRYKNGEHVAVVDGGSEFFKQDSLLLGARLQFGGKDLTGAAELAYVHTWPDGRSEDGFCRFAVGLEKRISDNVWLVFSLGKNSSSENSKDDVFAAASVRFGFSTKTRGAEH